MTSTTRPHPDGHPDPRKPGQRLASWALVAVCLGYFMVILDTTIVNVALPALRTDLGAGVAGLQWVVDGYLLMFAALLLSGGTLSDRLGARRVFQAGLGVFVVASVACGLAPGVPVLVAARLAQGVGAALSVPASLSLLRAAYPEQAARARAIGFWGGISGVAAAMGPLLGGLLVTEASWRLVFFVNVPVGLAAMVLTSLHVPAPAARPRSLDPVAQAVGVLSLTALTVALIEGGRQGVTPSVAAAAAVFAVTAALFVLIERRAPHPMLPPVLFREATFSGACAVGLLINLGFYGELFVINLYFQQVAGDSALRTGVALLPQMGVIVLGSSLSGRFTSRTGSRRRTMLIGLLIGGAGLLGLTAAGTHTPYTLLLAPLVAAGFGMSFTMPAVTTAVIESAPADRAGLASGAIIAVRQVGSVLGVALLGALVGGEGPLVPEIRVALACAGAAFLAGAGITLCTVERRGAPAVDRPAL